MDQRIECPSCNQPIVFAAKSGSIIWQILTVVFLVISICLAGVVAGSVMTVRQLKVKMSSDMAAEKAASAHQHGLDYELAMMATRQMIAEEISAREMHMVRDLGDEVLAQMKKTMNGSPAIPEVQLEVADWQKMFDSFTNDLAKNDWEDVTLSGHIAEDWGSDALVRSDMGDIVYPWPQDIDGHLAQSGIYVLRGRSDILPSTLVRGKGMNPLPIIFTNTLGEVRLMMSYEFRPDGGSAVAGK